MATRRIQSDRFLTVDFRPEIYSPLGMDWVQQNNMTSVILRHCPDLAALLPRGQTLSRLGGRWHPQRPARMRSAGRRWRPLRWVSKTSCWNETALASGISAAVLDAED